MSNNDLNEMNFDEDQATPVGDLKQLTDTVQTLKQCQKELKSLEDDVKKAKAEIQRLEGQTIPELMDECGLNEIILDTGEKIKVKAIVKANLPTKAAIEGQKDEDKKVELEHRLSRGLDWLRENGGEELIKNRIVVEFSKGQDNLAGDFEGKAAENGLPALRDTGVHNATLTKFVSEKIKKGEEVPMETFGVYCGRKAEVKKVR